MFFVVILIIEREGNTYNVTEYEHSRKLNSICFQSFSEKSVPMIIRLERSKFEKHSNAKQNYLRLNFKYFFSPDMDKHQSEVESIIGQLVIL